MTISNAMEAARLKFRGNQIFEYQFFLAIIIHLGFEVMHQPVGTLVEGVCAKAGETLFSFCRVCILKVLHLSPPSVRLGPLGDYGLLSIFFSHRMSFKLKGRQGDTLVTVLVQ